MRGLRLRVGDTCEAEVTRVRKLMEPHLREKIRIVTLAIYLPKKVRPYFVQLSWSLEKWGREPIVGEDVQVTFRDPPPINPRMDRGKFQITALLPPSRDIVGADGTVNPCSEIHLPPTGDTVNLRLDIEVEDVEDFLRQQRAVFMPKEKTMSKDRVRFWLDYRYLQHTAMYDVLKKVFNLDENRAKAATRSGLEEGFWIVCRPSQFARFMIYRNEAGIKNGFMDLKAELFTPPETPDYYAQLAQDHNIPRETVKSIIKALGYGHPWLAERISLTTKEPTEIDVSQNPDLSNR